MLIDGPGARVANSFPVPGGTATIHERAVIVSGRRGDVVVELHHPMIGRPSIVTPTARLGSIEYPSGAWPAAELERAVRGAVEGRFGLRPTGRSAPVVPMAFGPARVLSGSGTSLTISAMSCSATLEHRVLYDVVALADDGRWTVIAPHACYARADWDDFGLAHITDMHVARRIDSFRVTLEALGRTDAAARMFNWNDRFRGFIRYANQLHDEGILDVIVATGDLYDYLFERGDDHAGGGNAEFLRRLLLGQAPGPHFPDVEELRVPIFTVPGNHDYRVNPYELIFNIDLGTVLGERLVKNYGGYHLAWDDALALVTGRNGNDGDDVPDRGIDSAARMLDVDTVNRPYHRYLADVGSYVVELGPHRIAMLDSSWDVGVVRTVGDGLRTYLGTLTEDEEAFVGGSPNCEGVSPTELRMTAEALDATPDEGLFIVGIHAPLLNTQGTESPYFLRETQRAAHHEQVVGHLSRHTPKLRRQESVASHRNRITKAHRSWFAASDGERQTYVKRDSTLDLLDHGVSRGHADGLLRLLAGVGSRRSADVVLAGHTHRHNEFTVRPGAAGQLEFRMDFYTQNPSGYYPTRYLAGWGQDQDGSIVARTDTTYVEVSPAALASAHPWPMPSAAKHGSVVQVPPYADPLAAAPDAPAWWDRHRPLVLQTGALGPLENDQFSFSGFRVLTVEGGVITAVSHVPMARLHDAGYRLPWPDAVRPDPPRRHVLVRRSEDFGLAEAVDAPASCPVPGTSAHSFVFADGHGHLHDLYEDGAGRPGTVDLTASTGAPTADGSPYAYMEPSGQCVVVYRGDDGHVHSHYWRGLGNVGHDDLSGAAGGPKADGDPVGYLDPATGMSHVYYRSANGHLHEIWWGGPDDAPGTGDLTRAARAVPATGRPSAYGVGGTNVVVYRATDGRVRSLYWDTGAVGTDDLSGAAGRPRAAGDPVAYHTPHDGGNQVVYRGVDGHIHELWWIGESAVNGWDLSALAGAPTAASDLAAYYCAVTNTKHVVYRAADGHVHELWWTPGGGIPADVDLTVAALAPSADGAPTAFADSVGRQHVGFRGVDHQLHEIRWI